MKPKARSLHRDLAMHGTGLTLTDLLADKLRLYHDLFGHRGHGKDPHQCDICDLLAAYDKIQDVERTTPE